MSTEAQELAEVLAGSSDDALAAVFERRAVSAQAPWNDFFDAATELLEPAGITQALERLSHAAASALCAGSASPELVELALTDAEGAPLATVLAAAADRTVPALADAEAPPLAEGDAAHAAERAFTHLGAVAELLLALRSAPLTLLTGGAPSAAERRRFAETLTPGTDLDDVIAAAAEADLARLVGRALHITERGEAWLSHPARERWAALVEGFRDHLPPSLRSGQGGFQPWARWAAAEPWNPRWAEMYQNLRHRAVLLGLVTTGGAEPEWTVPLRQGAVPEVAALEALLPQEVDRIFLQNDLTAIAPGPLAPTLDLRLRGAAERESAAQASSYRFTAESLAHAFTIGEDEASLRSFLEGISLTGIPQALGYLITRTAQRHGLVRVQAEGARTRIRSGDPHLIQTLLVDQALRPLGLVLDGDDLVSRVSATTAFWSLSDARYPAVLLGDDDEPVAARRLAAAAPSAAERGEVYAALIARLRENHGPDSEAAWLLRALEAAARSRSQLLIEVAMPDGSTRELTLEATGLGGGRLRGLDRAADVERTLPVSSIRSARAAD